MMKKTYVTPKIIMVKMKAQKLICTSGVSADGIGWGGIDNSGNGVPE